MSEVIFPIEEALEGDFMARALGHSIYTEADSWEEFKSAIQDAVACHFETGQGPAIVRMHLVRDEVFSL